VNNFIRFIHRSVIKSNLEEFFVALRRRVNFVRKFIPLSLRHRFTSIGRFIPQSSSYPKDDRYPLTRDKTRFEINRSDYVQWRIFYGVRDNALSEAKKYLAPDSVVLDIGANFGAFSLRLASYALEQKLSNVHIHAFEPNPDVVKNYQKNLSLNQALSSIIHLHPFGLGREKSKRAFQFDWVNTGAGRIVTSKSSEQITISIERLDDWVQSTDIQKISFIKMIVEGFEPEVFRGGWKTIKKHKPPIFFEVTPHWYAENNSTLGEILDQLRTLGYTFRAEKHNELVPYDPARFEHLMQFNMMASIE
jgi:FkbM family methyltransferase